MTKAQKEQVINQFKDRFYISRVKKFDGFIKPHFYTLEQCYNNASSYKYQAFDDCLDIRHKIALTMNINVISSGIVSYNIMQFSYVVNFIDIASDKKYSLYITKDYNTLYAEVSD